MFQLDQKKRVNRNILSRPFQLDCAKTMVPVQTIKSGTSNYSCPRLSTVNLKPPRTHRYARVNVYQSKIRHTRAS